MYNFDKVIDRTPYYTAKFDPVKEGKGNGFYGDDYIYLQTADMDFQCSEGIRAEMQKLVDYNIYGYTKCTKEYGTDFYDAILTWIRKSQGLEFKRENLYYDKGVIPAIRTAVKAFAKPGEKLLVNYPIYMPLANVAKATGNILVNSQLVRDEDGVYRLNFDEIEELTADPSLTVYLFCSPHNPTGRVWTKEELCRVHEICQRNHVLLISDEVHCDFVWEPNKFVSMSTIGNGKGIVVCSGLAKTFNIAGLGPAFSIVTDSELMTVMDKVTGWIWPSQHTIAAVKGACLNSDEWYAEAKAYIRGNIDAAVDFIQTKMPKIRWYYPEGTYTLWLDFRNYQYSEEELHERIYERAKVIMHDGTWFDKQHGQGFQRICVPLPRARLLEALQRIAKELE